MMNRVLKPIVATAVALLSSPALAAAGDWDWSVTPYVWATAATVDVEIDDRDAFESTVEFADLLDDADFAGMFHVEGRKNKGGIFFDALISDFGDEPRTYNTGGLIELAAQSDLELTILELGGSYNPSGDGTGLTLVFGARMIDIDQEIDIDLPGPNGGERRIVDASGTAFDALAGLRYDTRFAGNWSFVLGGDVASGETDLTWSATALFGYHFGARDQLALRFGYRHLDVGLDEKDRTAEVETELELSGAVVGLTIGF